MTRIFLLGGLIFWALASVAQAQQARVALVIGNSAYEAVPQLLNPRRDADAVAKALREVGFRVRLDNDLSDGGVRRALRDFAAEAASSDWAVLYYAGHGI